MAKKQQRTKDASLTEVQIGTAAAGLAAEFLASLPEVQESGLTTADIVLQLEDRGWIGGAGTTNQRLGAELDERSRATAVVQSRGYWLRDPLAHQAVRLWTDYAFGDTGITFDGKVEDQVRAIVRDPRNRNLLSAAGQKRLSNKLLVDGEIFFAIFDDETVRTFDPLQMTIITDPDDEETTLGYRRRTATGKTLYYADWTLAPADYGKVADPDTKDFKRLQKQVKIYHAKFDAFGKRGNGLLLASLFWSREHRRFMESRVALTAALAKFAYNLTVKGGPKEVVKAQQKIQSAFAVSGAATRETNPPTTAGATFVHNEGADVTPMPRTTGATEAMSDSRNLKLMVCAGTGIMEHYFGDPSTGNLATATAMELPMLKMFQGYQKLWKDTFRDVFGVMLGEDVVNAPLDLTINMPPILRDDLRELGTFLTGLANLFPEIKVPEILQMCLVSLGVENVDELMGKIEDKRQEIDDQIASYLLTVGAPVGAPPPGAVPPGAPPPPKVLPKQLKESIEAWRALEKAVKQLTETTEVV